MSKFSNVKTLLFVIVIIFVSMQNEGEAKSTITSNASNKLLGKNFSLLNKDNRSLLKKLKKSTAKRGFGFEGTCTNDWTSTLYQQMPDKAAKIFTGVINPVANALHIVPQICAGDFSGTSINTRSELSKAQCNRIPLNMSHNYGVVAFSADNVQCGDKQSNIGVCLLFDDEGTGAVAFNGDALGCGISLTGVGAVLKPFLKYVGAIGFGVSLNKKFEKSVKVCYNDSSDSMTCGNIVAKGHFTFVMNLTVPKFNIANKKLADLIKLNATLTYLIDLGNTSLYAELANGIFNNNNTCQDDSNYVRTIQDISAEFTINVKGNCKLNLEKLTHGFIPDISMELNDNTLILTKGNGSTGLSGGLYLYMKANVVQAIYNIFSSLMNRFIKFFGVSMPTIDLSSLDSAMGLFINDNMLGVMITFPAVELKCYFRYSDKKGSCKFNSSIFTAILEAAKWVIKNAAEFFDDTGAKIAEFGNNSIDFASDAADAVADYSEKLARDATEISNSIINSAENAAKDSWNATVNAGQVAINSLSEVANQTAEFMSNACGEVVGFTNTSIDTIKDVAGEAANFFEGVGGSIVSGAQSAIDAIEDIGDDIEDFFDGW